MTHTGEEITLQRIGALGRIAGFTQRISGDLPRREFGALQGGEHSGCKED